MKRHHKFITAAYNFAAESHKPSRFSLCALIVKKNRVLAIGYNSQKTHPKATSRTQAIHAEMAAVFSAKRQQIDIRGSTIYVARYRTIGPGLALPCNKCYELLLKEGVRQVYFTQSSNLLKYSNIQLT